MIFVYSVKMEFLELKSLREPVISVMGQCNAWTIVWVQLIVQMEIKGTFKAEKYKIPEMKKPQNLYY